jgi:hypothetical protein
MFVDGKGPDLHPSPLVWRWRFRSITSFLLSLINFAMKSDILSTEKSASLIQQCNFDWAAGQEK